jgi:hypothetical protein
MTVRTTTDENPQHAVELAGVARGALERADSLPRVRSGNRAE